MAPLRAGQIAFLSESRQIRRLSYTNRTEAVQYRFHHSVPDGCILDN
jgi:hypothetical protein